MGKVKMYPNIRGMMAVRNFTQTDMAEKLGITYTTFNRKLNNDGIFSLKECKQIVDILGSTFDYLFLSRCPKNETEGNRNRAE